MNTINSVIKFDLHIHSKASGYKEDSDIVKESTKENLDTLFQKLNEYQVGLFSITDHNRFDADLYQAIQNKLRNEHQKYPDVKNVLAGIEFDVQLDVDMDKCHIISIFDTQEKDYPQISKILSQHLLTDPSASYSKDEFEKILREIGLNTILIAAQRKALTNPNGSSNSLSDSTKNVNQILKIKYIDALEFQKPKVEGILLNDLAKINFRIPLFSGSDCHEWSAYPRHDQNSSSNTFIHSKAKMLPTFKGLLMAVTSPNTRFDVAIPSEDSAEIKAIKIGDRELLFSGGINAIIGENGSGKTTLLEVLNQGNSRPHVKTLKENNKISVCYKASRPNIKYITQGQIVQNFIKNQLFEDSTVSNFNTLDTTSFENKYRDYANDLFAAIQKNIEKDDLKKKADTKSIRYSSDYIGSSYFIHIITDNSQQNAANKYFEPYTKIKNLLDSINEIVAIEYFNRNKSVLQDIQQKIQKLYEAVEKDYLEEDYKIKAVNASVSCIQNYNNRINYESTQRDKEISEFRQKRSSFIDLVLDNIHNLVAQPRFPDPPGPLPGHVTNRKQGFCFITKARYDEQNLAQEFLNVIFNKKYQNIDMVKKIATKEMLVEALSSCSSLENIEKKQKENVEKFINKYIEEEKTITEDAGNAPIGNTLGEMSLAYYKYYTQDETSWTVLMIDQPEDNISNNNIKSRLIDYLRRLSRGKQIIFVTHNPLLVVNMDVDNVIYVKNNNGKLNIVGGCLEYEDNNVNILDIVATSMDGGRETIEKRLTVYGKKD